MGVEGILTNTTLVKLVISIISSFTILLKLILQLTSGAGFDRKNAFKSTIMFHDIVYEHYKKIYNEIDTMFEWPRLETIVDFLLKIMIAVIAIVMVITIVAVIIVMVGHTIIPSKYYYYTVVVIVIIIVGYYVVNKDQRTDKTAKKEKKKSWSISLILANIVIPTGILGFILFYSMFTPQTSSLLVCNNTIHFQLSEAFNATTLKNNTIMLIQDITNNKASVIALKILGNKSTCTANLSIGANSSCNLCLYHYQRESYYKTTNIIIAFTLEILWLFMFSRAMLMTKGRELEILQDENSIKNAVFGLLSTLATSGIIVVFWVLKLSSLRETSYLLEVITAMIGIVILAYLISNIKETAVRLLWKAKVRDFADNLPHLIVKSKTGNIYYGQLYDPLDRKVLVLRKSKLMHSGQIIEDSNLVTKMSEEGGYWSILWKDIESIKIVEDGLYAPPNKPDSNFSPQDTGKSSEKDEKDKGKKPESTTEKTGNESKSKI